MYMFDLQSVPLSAALVGFLFLSALLLFLSCSFYLCVCQMGLLCGQVFRQEIGLSRYCLHLLQSASTSCTRLSTEAKCCHLVANQRFYSVLSRGCKAQPKKWSLKHLPFVNLLSQHLFVFQVNGTLVTHSNHIEVVKLIKCKFFCLCSSLNNIIWH